jgi:nicotinamidase-related amidase
MTTQHPALVVIDVQTGFDDPYWGPRNNPDAERNIGLLVERWQATGRPLVLVRHVSTTPDSPLAAGPGTAFKRVLDGVEPDLLITKSVHSAFHGDTDLHAWLSSRGIEEFVVAGIQTNRCCETTTRVGGDLGYRVLFVLDATYTFDETTAAGVRVTADEFARVTAANLDGHFATVLSTAQVLARESAQVRAGSSTA